MIGTTHNYTAKNNRVILTKCTVSSYNNKCYISFELTCFGAEN
jgi:hypothetical protein